jgi:hypothetical protein
MKLVNCKTCNKEYEITQGHYYKNTKYRKGNFYCSRLCKDGTLEKRFWEKVIKTDNIEDCWEWNGASRSKFGYGSISFNGKLIDSHRLSWMIFNNNYDIISKDYVCHKCDNPKCVNPNHLFLGNAKINAQDAYDKGRIIVPEGIKFELGHKPLNAEIDKEKVIKIRDIIIYRKNNSIKLNLKKLAKEHNVKYQTVRDISANRTYTNY